MSTLAQSTTACEDFKQDVLKGNIISAQKKLDALKVLTKLVSYFIEILSELTCYSFLQDLLLDCDSLPPIVSNTANAQAEQAIARETLEYAVILSIKSGDKSSFQRYLSSLRPYYTASRWAHNLDDGIKPSYSLRHLWQMYTSLHRSFISTRHPSRSQSLFFYGIHHSLESRF